MSTTSTEQPYDPDREDTDPPAPDTTDDDTDGDDVADTEHGK